MEIHPSGWLDGIDTPGNLGGVAAVSPPGDMISLIMINWGEMGTEYNFGELLPGSIEGIVAVSTDPACEPRDGEPRLEGVQIDLLDASGNVLATTTTDANGQYSFTGLRPGVYGVREHQPAGYFDLDAHVGTGTGTRLTPSLIGDIDIGSDQHLFEYDFCEEPPAELSGYVFIDGPPIVTNEVLTPEQIAALRDGPADVRRPDARRRGAGTATRRVWRPDLCRPGVAGALHRCTGRSDSRCYRRDRLLSIHGIAGGNVRGGGAFTGGCDRRRRHGRHVGRFCGESEPPERPYHPAEQCVAHSDAKHAGDDRVVSYAVRQRCHCANPARCRPEFAAQQFQRSNHAADSAAGVSAAGAACAATGVCQAGCTVRSQTPVSPGGAADHSARNLRRLEPRDRLHVAFERGQRRLAAEHHAGRGAIPFDINANRCGGLAKRGIGSRPLAACNR